MIEPPNHEEIEKLPEEKEEAQATESKTMEVEIAEAKQDAAQYKDKYLRNLAEMENSRKRLQKEKQELTQYAIQNVILDFLPPLDHLENALRFADQASSEVQHWATGFQMILTQFKDALANNGVAPIISKGMPFDHNCHEAVEMIVTNEFPPGTVVEENVRGYRMGDRVLRPARVKVAKEPTSLTDDLPGAEDSQVGSKENGAIDDLNQ